MFAFVLEVLLRCYGRAELDCCKHASSILIAPMYPSSCNKSAREILGGNCFHECYVIEKGEIVIDTSSDAATVRYDSRINNNIRQFCNDRRPEP